MPSKKIYLNTTGETRYPSKYRVYVMQDVDIEGYSTTEVGNYLKDIYFDLGEPIKNQIPENTYVTSIVLNYNCMCLSSSTLTLSYFVGNSSGEYSTSIDRVVSINTSTLNTIEVKFLSGEIENIHDLSKIHLHHWKDITRNDLQKPGSNYTGLSPGGAYEYYSVEQFFYFTVNMSSRPSLTINYEYNPPEKPTSLAPSNSTENPRTPIRFTWNSKINQVAYELQYQVNNGSWSTVSNATADRYYDMPAGTITETEGTVNWKVRVAETSGVYSEFEQGSFNLGTAENKAPQLNYPVSDYIKNANTIRFGWTFIPNTIETQTAFELQYKVANDNWNTVTETTDREYKDIALNINESTIVEWKLRCQNQFDEWTPWTKTVQFQIIGTPPIPQIFNITNTNKPVITWQSRDQEMFKIEILKDGDVVYNSGKIVGTTIREFKIPIDLENGKYIFKLTVFNIYDVESPTVEYTHIIEPVEIAKPDIGLFESRFFVLVKTDTLKGTVLRNGKAIGELQNGEFYDYSGVNKKVYDYKIRTYENDVFADSEIKSGSVDFEHHNTLASVNNLKDYILLSYDLDGEPQKTVNLKLESAFISLDGRRYYEVETGEHEEETKSFSCFITSKNILDKLINMVKSKEFVLFRDTRENNFEGFIDSLSYEHHTFGYKVSFTLMRTGDFYE